MAGPIRAAQAAGTALGALGKLIAKYGKKRAMAMMKKRKAKKKTDNTPAPRKERIDRKDEKARGTRQSDATRVRSEQEKEILDEIRAAERIRKKRKAVKKRRKDHKYTSRPSGQKYANKQQRADENITRAAYTTGAGAVAGTGYIKYKMKKEEKKKKSK